MRLLVKLIINLYYTTTQINNGVHKYYETVFGLDKYTIINKIVPSWCSKSDVIGRYYNYDKWKKTISHESCFI